MEIPLYHELGHQTRSWCYLRRQRTSARVMETAASSWWGGDCQSRHWAAQDRWCHLGLHRPIGTRYKSQSVIRLENAQGHLHSVCLWNQEKVCKRTLYQVGSRARPFEAQRQWIASPPRKWSDHTRCCVESAHNCTPLELIHRRAHPRTLNQDRSNNTTNRHKNVDQSYNEVLIHIAWDECAHVSDKIHGIVSNMRNIKESRAEHWEEVWRDFLKQS